MKKLERKLRGFHPRVFRFGYSAKWKTRSLEKGLKENSEVFISEFSVLGIVQNGKLGVGKTRSLAKRQKPTKKLKY